MHCPFCGEDAELNVQYTRSPGTGTQWKTYTYFIVCTICGTRGPTVESTTLDVARDGAVDGWNTRITHDEDLAGRMAFALAS